MTNNLTININSINDANIKFNNKFELQCSYLINEIKRKNSSLLLPINIKNKKIYLKDKLITNKKSHIYLKRKDNIKKLISRNIHKNVLFKNLSEDNIKLKEGSIIPNNNISLISLYHLPKVKVINNVHCNKSIIIKKSEIINYKKKNFDEINDKKRKDFLGVKNYMKEKFYSDTENKLKNKIKTKYFRNDKMVKQKIIFMKKFGIFWKGFIQYCTPIIRSKIYKIDNENKNKNNENNLNSKDENNNKNNIKYIKKIKSLSLPKIN